MSGYRTIGPSCVLGEGPLWHPERNELFWFDIPKSVLYCCDAQGGSFRQWGLGEPASAAGWIDRDTLLVATASGLQRFDLRNGTKTLVLELEADSAVTRSNDGRTGPDGSFWISTMGRGLEPFAGAYYRYKDRGILKLIDRMTIPNATCFAPDGAWAYLADTAKRVIWRWRLDTDGNPYGQREVHIDLRDEGVNPDGAVCDAEGCLWSAQYGASRLVRYAPDGSEDEVISLPVSQPTCPAFGGSELRTLYITSARENLSESALAAEPEAGRVIVLDVDVPGTPEFRVTF